LVSLCKPWGLIRLGLSLGFIGSISSSLPPFVVKEATSGG